MVTSVHVKILKNIWIQMALLGPLHTSSVTGLVRLPGRILHSVLKRNFSPVIEVKKARFFACAFSSFERLSKLVGNSKVKQSETQGQTNGGEEKVETAGKNSAGRI